MMSGFGQIARTEGAGALLTGLGPTVVGYFVQGWFKFGGVEFFKIQASSYLGERDAFKYRTGIYLGKFRLFLCLSIASLVVVSVR